MTQLRELRKQAKEKGFKGYSTMRVGDLQLLLAGKRVPKRLRKNQVSKETQTDFLVCNDCRQKAYWTRLFFKADANKRKVIVDGELEIDAETGEVIGCAVDYGRRWTSLSEMKWVGYL